MCTGIAASRLMWSWSVRGPIPAPSSGCTAASAPAVASTSIACLGHTLASPPLPHRHRARGPELTASAPAVGSHAIARSRTAVAVLAAREPSVRRSPWRDAAISQGRQDGTVDKITDDEAHVCKRLLGVVALKRRAPNAIAIRVTAFVLRSDDYTAHVSACIPRPCKFVIFS